MRLGTCAVTVRQISVARPLLSCSCCIHPVCGLQVLDLTDYDTGLPVSRGDIKSFSHRRIRVTYKPKDVGDFTYIVHLQNNYDERNSKSVPFRCIVSFHNSGFFFTVDFHGPGRGI